MEWDVFVYGTLLDPHRIAAVLDIYEFGPDAHLEGVHRVDGTYPTLVPGGRADGAVIHTPDIEALDHYEGVDEGLYVRVSVPWSAGDGTVEVYVGDPGRLGVEAGWPDGGSLRQRVERYVEAHPVVVQPQ